MASEINTNFNNSFQGIETKKENIQQTLAKSTQAVSDSFESSSPVKTISSTAGDGGFAQAAPLVPLLYVVDKALDGTMSGNVETNLLGKVAKLGDKISDALHLEKFISGKKLSKVKNAISENIFTKYFTNEYRANPISLMAKMSSFSKTMGDKLDDQAQKLLSIFTEIKYNPVAFEELKKLATISPDTISFIEGLGPLKQRLTPEFLTSVSSVMDELTGLAVNDGKAATALKENLARFMSSADDISELALSEQLSSFFSKFAGGKYAGTAVSLSDDAARVVASVAGGKVPTQQILNAVDDLAANSIPVGNKAFSIARNKAAAASSKIGNTTLGKLFAKGTVRTKDIATYGGGLISLFFMASSISNAIKATKEAPKGEKKATFMHVLSEQYLGMILFQPSVNLVYNVAGNKYRGMTVNARKALADLISKTNADETLTKEGLKIANLQKKLLLKGVEESKVATLAGKGLKEAKEIAKSLKKEGAKLKFWEKPLKVFGTLLGTGLDKMKIPKFANILGKKIKIPQPTMKGFLGGFGRFALILFVIQPLIQKPLTKLTHKIFGEPKSYLAKQKDSGEPQKTPSHNQVVTEQTEASFDINQVSDTNLVKRLINNQNTAQPISSTPINDGVQSNNGQAQKNESIAALNLFNKKEQERYIPSIDPYIPVDNSAEINARVKEIMNKTDKVVTKTEKYLN